VAGSQNSIRDGLDAPAPREEGQDRLKINNWVDIQRGGAQASLQITDEAHIAQGSGSTRTSALSHEVGGLGVTAKIVYKVYIVVVGGG